MNRIYLINSTKKLNNGIKSKKGIFLAFFMAISLIKAYGQCSPDVTAPIITCQSDTIYNSDMGSCGAIFNYNTPLATDNCPSLQTTTFSYTGAMETFTVPSGVTSITIEVWGAQGEGGQGGLGGYAMGDLTVTPGQVLNLFVGGQSGFNGGGVGFAAIPRNGGGASDVRLTGTTLNDRIIVAGGGGAGGQNDAGTYTGGAGGGGTATANYAGGGGGEGYGGAGGAGGNIGGTGNSSAHSGGAGGGGFTTGGDGSCNTSYSNSCGQNGSFGLGGNGDTWETGICYTDYGGTCGGGGGYYGGGGTSVGNCGSGAGGGGSSWTGSLSNSSMTPGIQTADGQISISYDIPVTITQTAGLISGSLFPIGTTVQTFEAEDAAGNISACSYNVTILSTVDVSTTLTNVTTLTANNSNATYQWIDCDNSNLPISGETNQSFTAVANGNYAVIIDENGCVDTSMCTSVIGLGINTNSNFNKVNVYPNPTIGNYTIELDRVYDNVNVIITDISGKEIEHYTLTNVSKFSKVFKGEKGTYLIHIITDTNKKVTTLIVE